MSRESAEAADIPPGFEPIRSSNPFASQNGPIYERIDDEGWVRGFRVEDRHCNAGGVCHGGWLMTVADVVLARAVMEVAEPPFVTLRLVSDFVTAVPQGVWVEGRAHTTRAGRSVVHVDGALTWKGRTVLSVSGIFKRLGHRRDRGA